MSHFSTLVLSGGKISVDEIMEPFWELDLTQEEMEFDPRAVFNVNFVNSPLTGIPREKEHDPYLAATFKGTETVVEALERWWDRHGKNGEGKDRYPTIGNWINEWHGYLYNPRIDAWGWWSNPNGKWDWWVHGGRWSNELILKPGRGGVRVRCNDAYVKYIDWAYMVRRNIDFWRKVWHYKIDNPVGERRRMYGREREAREKYSTMLRRDYLLETYKTKEEYARVASAFSTHAVIDKKGQWHEGSSRDKNWIMDFWNRFIKPLNPNDHIYMVDCHS